MFITKIYINYIHTYDKVIIHAYSNSDKITSVKIM